jgi:hypothetical protein
MFLTELLHSRMEMEMRIVEGAGARYPFTADILRRSPTGNRHIMNANLDVNLILVEVEVQPRRANMIDSIMVVLGHDCFKLVRSRPQTSIDVHSDEFELR